MAKTANDSIQNNSPKSLDQKYTVWNGELSVPYSSLTEVNNANNPNFRSRGLTFLVNENGEDTEYWYKNGTTNSDLVKKVNIPVLLGFTGSGTSSSPLNLIKDVTPIENSINPITSGAVFNRFITFRNELDIAYNTSTTPNLQDVTSGQYNNITDQPLKIGNRLDIGINGSYIKDDDNSLDISSATDVTMASGDYSIGVSTTGIKISKYSQTSVPTVNVTFATTSGIVPISVNNVVSNTAGNIQLSSVNGSFTTVDGKIITVSNGVITSIISG